MTTRAQAEKHLPQQVGGTDLQVQKAGEPLRLEVPSEELTEQVIARASLDPEIHAAQVHRDIPHIDYPVSINDMAAAVRQSTERVVAGDLSRMEAMLTSQAHTLDLLFAHLTRRALKNFAKHPETADTYLRLALKAQGQCRTTVEALAEIKNPKPVAFVRQANIAHGPQQVNNGPALPSRAGAGEIQSTANKLMAVTHEEGQMVDAGAAAGAGRANQAVQALGEVHRTANPAGQGKGRPERRKARRTVGGS